MSHLEVEAEESRNNFKTEMTHLTTTLVSSQCFYGVLLDSIHMGTWIAFPLNNEPTHPENSFGV